MMTSSPAITEDTGIALRREWMCRRWWQNCLVVKQVPAGAREAQMHIADVHKGMLGANGIVGGGFPLAAGAALTAKFNGRGQVAVCFFGDGASNQGTFHESLNLASIWKLPVIFVAENNGYAESTPVTYHMSCRDIAERAVGYDMPGVTVDGLNVL